MSVGGADHRLPQCNHFTLFGSAVSVVEFPPAPQVPLLDGSEVSRQEKLFHSLQTLFLSCIASFESTARRPLYHWVRATPHFLEENVAVTLSAWRKVLSRTQRLPKIANIEALDSQA